MTPLTGCDLSGYVCTACEIRGVRLFREYQTFLNHINLLCQPCALDEQGKTEPTQGGTSIGWRVAAVPAPADEGEKQSFWGFTSVPDEGVDWWHALPISVPR